MQTPTMCFFSHFTAACFWFSEALELSMPFLDVLLVKPVRPNSRLARAERTINLLAADRQRPSQRAIPVTTATKTATMSHPCQVLGLIP